MESNPTSGIQQQRRQRLRRHVWMALFLLSLLLPTRSNGFVVNAPNSHGLGRVATKSMSATNDPKTQQEEPSSSPPEDDVLPLLFNLLSPPPKCDVDRMSSTDLAYIGDVVYELLVRSKKVWPSKRTSDLQQQVVRLVRAEFQSTLVTRLRQNDNDDNDAAPTIISFQLTDQEARVMNRGRNAATKTNHRKANPVAYQDATALEALVGYLYISNPSRCTQLLQWIDAQL